MKKGKLSKIAAIAMALTISCVKFFIHWSILLPSALSVNIFLSDIQYNNRYSALLLLLF